jgi:tetratricopeptide (TPR) repeat protein
VNAQPLNAAVDARNPWLGLASFTEETRQYFYGRDEEVGELARRVQRKLLTVLFGQSGLGKTSILRAGLVPRLRGQGYCPVYVRIDYARSAPEPSEQIKQAIVDAAKAAGQWSQVGVAAPGESLWEFLHHRDDVLRDANGSALIPLLIFDQFEEIFTLAQSDDFGRQRAAQFVTDLADLVENRPPKAVEARFDEDDTAAERFDFGRSDYRVVIALREDYLAPLESLKQAMPSITQNRQRLAPMTGQQAMAAVLQPGKGLVTEEVAAAIVRFVAGGGEIANAEVEPSLLSLICRELNDARIAQGRNDISLDLLAGSHATILSNFYERSLADQPAALRQFIEEQLLTASGYRENIAEESVRTAFVEAGAAPDALAVLVNRRLLRIEERLDVRRVELTHDVLCGVVKASRDARHEREARHATERVLAEQRAREQAARHALVRARQVASICGVLALGAIIAALFAVSSTRRAVTAEHDEQQIRHESEQARTGAEQLLSYLSDDFARELESFGRLNSVAEFSKRQIDYFHSLPANLRGADTTRSAALAMVHYARALRILGETDAAGASAAEAVSLVQGLRDRGDHSEATLIALVKSMTMQSMVMDVRNDAGGPELSKQALALLQPLVDAPGTSTEVRRTYADVLQRIGYESLNENKNEEVVSQERRAMDIYASLGGRDLTDLEAAANYAEASAWLITADQNLNRNAEAIRDGQASLAMTDKVLAQRPGYRLALHAAQVIGTVIAGVENNELNPKEALRAGLRDEEVAKTMVSLDPKSTVSTNNLGVVQTTLGDTYWAEGRLKDAIPYYQKGVENFRLAAAGGGGQVLLYVYQTSYAIWQLMQQGEIAGSDAMFAAIKSMIATQGQKTQGVLKSMIDDVQPLTAGIIAYERDQLPEARKATTQALDDLQGLHPRPGFEDVQTYILLFNAGDLAGRTAYLQGDFATAEKYERIAVEARQKFLTDAVGDRRDLMIKNSWLAMAIARQGRLPEAAQIVAPAVEYQRQLMHNNHGDQWLPVELAQSLFAQALTDPGQRGTLLHEAASLLDAAPAEIRSVHDVHRLRQMVDAALSGKAPGPA